MPVRGSIFVSVPRSLAATQTAPSPNAITFASGSGMLDTTRPLTGSIRATRDSPYATQTAPAPTATPPPVPGLDRPSEDSRIRVMSPYS